MQYRDYFGKDAAVLRGKKLFLFDMDGTIYNEGKLFDGTLALLKEITSKNGNYVFVTNNSSKSVNDYIQKVNQMGIPADRSNFFTSSLATIIYLQENYKGKKVYCQGTVAFVNELADAGIWVTEESLSDVDIVLVGFDTELTSQKLRNSCQLLYRGLPFIATNPDLSCPVDFGFIPDCGSICQMLENATGRHPVYIGKPEPTMVNIAMSQQGYCKDETVIVGDRLYTDIATGINADITAVCVLTGEATVADIKSSSIKPTFTLESVKSLFEIIKR